MCVGLRPTPKKKEVSGGGEGERGAETMRTERWEGRVAALAAAGHTMLRSSARLKKYSKNTHQYQREGANGDRAEKMTEDYSVISSGNSMWEKLCKHTNGSTANLNVITISPSAPALNNGVETK